MTVIKVPTVPLVPVALVNEIIGTPTLALKETDAVVDPAVLEAVIV